MTGSRDRSIKVWSLRTGKLLRTLRGHAGSVLCLKFDKTGFMVSGSSDCSIIAWDLSAKPGGGGAGGGAGGAGGESEIRAVLTGHRGGVLDLRIDDQWIVSWCVSPLFPLLFSYCSLSAASDL